MYRFFGQLPEAATRHQNSLPFLDTAEFYRCLRGIWRCGLQKSSHHSSQQSSAADQLAQRHSVSQASGLVNPADTSTLHIYILMCTANTQSQHTGQCHKTARTRQSSLSAVRALPPRHNPATTQGTVSCPLPSVIPNKATPCIFDCRNCR